MNQHPSRNTQPSLRLMPLREIIENLGNIEVEEGKTLKEAYTRADVELALDDRGWNVSGGKRMPGELDPITRASQVGFAAVIIGCVDALAKQAVRLWTDYAFGDVGISYIAEDEEVQTKLDKFTKDRRNKPASLRLRVNSVCPSAVD